MRLRRSAVILQHGIDNLIQRQQVPGAIAHAVAVHAFRQSPGGIGIADEVIAACGIDKLPA